MVAVVLHVCIVRTVQEHCGTLTNTLSVVYMNLTAVFKPKTRDKVGLLHVYITVKLFENIQNKSFEYIESNINKIIGPWSKTWSDNALTMLTLHVPSEISCQRVLFKNSLDIRTGSWESLSLVDNFSSRGAELELKWTQNWRQKWETNWRLCMPPKLTCGCGPKR